MNGAKRRPTVFTDPVRAQAITDTDVLTRLDSTPADRIDALLPLNPQPNRG